LAGKIKYIFSEVSFEDEQFYIMLRILVYSLQNNVLFGA
jgi:hypothetical protein